jgi:hypothetical protein
MKPDKLQPAIYGGLFIGVLSALPFVSIANACCCLWVVAGGVLAAYLMQQNFPAPITAGDGAAVGLLSGIIGAVVTVVVTIPINLALGPMQRRVIERLLDTAQDVPPEMREMLTSMQMGVGALVLSFFMYLAAGLIFGTLGGLLGATLFRKSAPPPPPPPGEVSPIV